MSVLVADLGKFSLACVSLQEIYDLGARLFFIAGIPPIGCIPQQIGNSNESRGECIGSSNLLAQGFNYRLEDLLLESNAMLPGSSFIFWDNYKLTTKIINNYSAYGNSPPSVSASCWVSDIVVVQ